MSNAIDGEDRRVQELAIELAQAIRARSDHDKVEYVAAIYRDGDTLRATELFTENNHFRADAAPAIAAAGGADRVVGLVHNHPMEIVRLADNQPDTLAANRLPSENDWNSARAQFGERTDASLFVLGPDDRLRRYEYEDRQRWVREVVPGPFDRGGYNPRPGPTIELPALRVERESAPAGGQEDRGGAAGPAPTAAGLVDPRAGRLHAEARQAVAEMESGLGIAWNPNSERAAACVGRVAHERGFDGIVAVGLNRAGDGQQAGELLCIQGRSANPDPYANRATIPTREAMNTPVEESMRRTDAAQAQAPAQEQAAPEAAQRPSAPSR